MHYQSPSRSIYYDAWQVQSNPPWFLALVWGELLFQLPFFFVASYAFIYQKKWIRIPALVGVMRCTVLSLKRSCSRRSYDLTAKTSHFPRIIIRSMACILPLRWSPSSAR